MTEEKKYRSVLQDERTVLSDRPETRKGIFDRALQPAADRENFLGKGYGQFCMVDFFDMVDSHKGSAIDK